MAISMHNTDCVTKKLLSLYHFTIVKLTHNILYYNTFLSNMQALRRDLFDNSKKTAARFCPAAVYAHILSGYLLRKEKSRSHVKVVAAHSIRLLSQRRFQRSRKLSRFLRFRSGVFVYRANYRAAYYNSVAVRSHLSRLLGV